MSEADDVLVTRLDVRGVDVALRMFAVLNEVFETHGEVLSAAYVEELLARSEFWALAAIRGDAVIGGLTAHQLPMTRAATSELFIYDLAVPGFIDARGSVDSSSSMPSPWALRLAPR